MKARMALAMIEGPERDGLISPGDTIVEDAVIVTLAVDSGFKYLSVSPFADLARRTRLV